MKKKTLATASLLLALLMPLGATPLAVCGRGRRHHAERDFQREWGLRGDGQNERGPRGDGQHE